MGQFKELEPVDLIETGTEPEFFVTEILKADYLPDGNIRFYVGSRRGKNVVRLEFCVVTSVAAVSGMARKAIQLAAEAHNFATITTGLLNS